MTDEITGILLGGRYVSSHFQGAGWLNDYTWTDVCGNYHLGVVSGSNDIYFSGGNHNDAEFFDNAGNPDDALPVTVAANQTASNINAALSPDSTSITGWIKGPAGAPLTANISAAQLEGSTWVTKAQVSSDPQTGYYAFPDLPEGKYRIKFESNNYDIEVWDKGDGATDYSQGKDVVVWKEDYFSQGGINATLMHKDVTSECIAGDDLNLTGFTVGTHDRTTTGMLATSPNAVVPEGAIVKLTAGSGIGFGKPFSVHNTGMLQAIVAPGISCP